MCGIAGFFDSTIPRDDLAGIARAMGDAIAHRGPDDQGIWLDEDASLALSHRRLSIVDLSPAGHQPMISASGRFVLVFNGEIYNHRELRQQLEAERLAPEWRGCSDTEVLLEATAAWGLDRALSASRGMFALALYDRSQRTLSLARDRLGEKPLYFGRAGSAFLFASEVSAFAQHPRFSGEIDGDAVADFMRYSYVPAPRSIYCGLQKLKPGMIADVDVATGTVETRAYWGIETAYEGAVAQRMSQSRDEAIEAFDALLRSAVSEQMIADVPLGAFLSGGIDSSLVVAMMQTLSARPVRTFTIGFEAAQYNEAPFAKAVAAHLGTAHTELYVTERDALDVVADLSAIYSEPFADASQIPTFLVAKLARQSVTVALSGDGGDEVFGGYSRHQLARARWAQIARLPFPVRQRISRLFKALPPSVSRALIYAPLAALGKGGAPTRFDERLSKEIDAFGARDDEGLYQLLSARWPLAESPVLSGRELPLPNVGGDSHMRHMMLCDMARYLPDDVLHKVDRAAMSRSLETRVPLLDQRIVEFGMSLSDDVLAFEGTSKWPMRALLARYVPPALTNRPKMGFSLPIGDWLRGGLREWAEDLLSEASLRADGYLDARVVRGAWARHLAGNAGLEHGLWNALMLTQWLRSSRGARSQIQGAA